MRKYHLFNKPAKVSDVLQADLNTDISSNWSERAEQLQARRWRRLRRVRLQRPILTKKPRHGSLRGGLGQMLET